MYVCVLSVEVCKYVCNINEYVINADEFFRVKLLLLINYVLMYVCMCLSGYLLLKIPL